MFPLVLATLFKMAFGNLNSLDAFNPVKVAVVDNEFYQSEVTFQAVLESIESADSPLLEVSLLEEGHAKEALEAGKVEGIITLTGPMAKDKLLSVARSGIGESILKSFLERYSESQLMIERLVQSDPTKIPAAVEAMNAGTTFLNAKTLAGKEEQNPELNYFFSLMAMACMYGAFFGTNEVNAIQANISTRAARVNLAPVHKLKVFLYSGAAAVLVQVLEMMILLVYMRFVLSIDFGEKTLLVVATTILSSFVGVSFGAFISALVKGNEGIKMAIILSVSMVGSMLSGMMVSSIKYLVTAHAPILKFVNPVNLVTDAFYALYFYEDLRRYSVNALGLVLFALFFSLGTYFVIRGRKYASL